MDLKKVPVGKNAPYDVNVIIEIRWAAIQSSTSWIRSRARSFVDRFLHTAMYYPFNYGFIPHTLSEDGDPVDAAVIGQVPVTPGVVIRSRPIGVLIMEDEAGPSWRCRRNRAAPSDRLHLRTIKAVLKGRADEIVQLTKTTSCAEAPHQLEPPLPFAAA